MRPPSTLQKDGSVHTGSPADQSLVAGPIYLDFPVEKDFLCGYRVPWQRHPFLVETVPPEHDSMRISTDRLKVCLPCQVVLSELESLCYVVLVFEPDKTTQGGLVCEICCRD